MRSCVQPGKGYAMFWGQRAIKLTGLVLLLLASAVIIDAVLETAILGDADPFDRGDTEGILLDINDNESLFFIGSGIAVVADGFALLATAGMLWLVFRDRSPVLAVLGLVGLMAASAAFLISDAGYVTTALLAADFVEEGGPAGIPAGDPATLQAARAVMAFSALADLLGLLVLALGLIAFGSVVAWAPEGAVNPPRWLGFLGIASSVALLSTWTIVFEEYVGWTAGGIGILGTLLFVLILGGWLLSRPDEGRVPAASKPLAEAI